MKKIYSSIFLCFILSITSLSSFATFTILTSVTDPTCDGAHNGILTITPTGGVAPYTYSLDGGATFQASNVFTNLEGGATYNVIVMDVNGDNGSETVVTNLGTPLTANVSKTDALCLAGTNASLTLNNVNATAPFTYRISGGYYIDSLFAGAPTLSFTGIRADFYNILIEDALGCFGYATADIQEGDSLTGTSTVFPVSCTGSDDAIFTFSFSTGGTAPFTLDDVANNIFGSSMGTPTDGFGGGHEGTTYNFSITDALGCVGAVSAVVPVSLPAITHAGNDAGICTAGSIQLSGSGNGTLWAPYYQWSPSIGLDNSTIANPVATPSATTTYTLTTWTTSWNNLTICPSSSTVTISVFDVQAPSIAQNASLLSVTNSQAGVTYTWQQDVSGTWSDVGTGTSYTAVSGNDYRVKASNGGCEVYSNSFSAARMANTNPYGVINYPNPTTDVLRLTELKLEDGWQTAEIISSQGLRTFPVNDIRNKTAATFNVAGLGAGVYLVKLTGADGKTTTLTFIKQ